MPLFGSSTNAEHLAKQHARAAKAAAKNAKLLAKRAKLQAKLAKANARLERHGEKSARIAEDVTLAEKGQKRSGWRFLPGQSERIVKVEAHPREGTRGVRQHVRRVWNTVAGEKVEE